MCIAPINLAPDSVIACRKCWQCLRDRVDDLCGRCIAEQNTSDQTLSVTLTYDDALLAKEARETGQRTVKKHAETLVYSDVQKFLKRLRNRGYNVRYIVAGEYGSRKGRAHWHIVLFFQGKTVPLRDLKGDVFEPQESVFLARAKNDRITWAPWHLGQVLIQQPEYASFRYVLKYVLKDLDSEYNRTHLAMSKKPPLGHDWLLGLAQAYVDQGLPLHNAQYSFRDEFKQKANGQTERRKFQLRGRMKEIFLQHYFDSWLDKYRQQPPETEFLLENFLDKKARLEGEANKSGEWWHKYLSDKKGTPSLLESWQWLPWLAHINFKTVREYYFDPKCNRYAVLLYWAKDRGTFINFEKETTWPLKDAGEIEYAISELQKARY